jgi:antitoxin CcdA
LGKTVTVSAKVKKELKDKLQKQGISISQVVRRAIESEVKKIEEEELKNSLAEASKVLEKVNSDVLVEVIRKSREEKA